MSERSARAGSTIHIRYHRVCTTSSSHSPKSSLLIISESVTAYRLNCSLHSPPLELCARAAAVRRKGHTDTGTCGSYAGRLSSHVREYEIRKDLRTARCLPLRRCGLQSARRDRMPRRFLPSSPSCSSGSGNSSRCLLCKIDELKINADDRSGGEFVFDILSDAVSDVADHIFIRVADLLIVNIVAAPSVAREAVMCLCYRTVGILRSRGSSFVGRKTRCNGRLTLILSVNMLNAGVSDFFCIGGNVDVIGFERTV